MSHLLQAAIARDLNELRPTSTLTYFNTPSSALRPQPVDLTHTSDFRDDVHELIRLGTFGIRNNENETALAGVARGFMDGRVTIGCQYIAWERHSYDEQNNDDPSVDSSGSTLERVDCGSARGP